MPSRDDQEPFASTINRLIKEHPGSPTFLPHVTFLTGLGVDERPLDVLVNELSRTLREWSVDSLDLDLEAPRAGRIFFQAITQPVTQSTPGGQTLLDGRRRLEKTFDKPTPSDKPYYPHLSLLYSEKPVDELEKIAAELDDHGKKVRMQEVSVVLVQGPVEEWKEVARLKMNGERL